MCTVINYGGSGQWKDQKCIAKRKFVCKIKSNRPKDEADDDNLDDGDDNYVADEFY